MDRPVTVVAAAVLHLVIGVSGMFVGGTLLAALPNLAAPGFLDRAPVLLGLPLYGLLEVVGGVGIWLGSRRGWWLAVVADLFGLGILAWTLSLAGPDPILLFGVVVWLVALGLLVAPDTRHHMH